MKNSDNIEIPRERVLPNNKLPDFGKSSGSHTKHKRINSNSSDGKSKSKSKGKFFIDQDLCQKNGSVSAAAHNNANDLFMKSYPYGGPLTPPRSASSSLTEASSLLHHYQNTSTDTADKTSFLSNTNNGNTHYYNNNSNYNHSHTKNVHPHPHSNSHSHNHSNNYAFPNSHLPNKSHTKKSSIMPSNVKFAGASFTANVPKLNDLPKPSFV